MRTAPSRAMSSCAAFTLVELLVVIGIIALLISILLPSLNAARQQAYTIKCLANLRSIGQGLNIYAASNRQSLPYGYWAPDSTNNGKTTDWAILVASSLGKGSGTYGSQNGTDKSMIQGLFTCPTAEKQFSGMTTQDRKLHYSAHPRVMPDIYDADTLHGGSGYGKAGAAGVTGPRLVPYKLSAVKRPSDIAIVFDANLCNIEGYAPGDLKWNANAIARNLDDGGLYQHPTPQNGREWNFLVVKSGMDTTQAIYAPNDDAPPNYQQAFTIRWRHNRNDTANFLFADGHAGSFRLRQGQNSDAKMLNFYLDN